MTKCVSTQTSGQETALFSIKGQMLNLRFRGKRWNPVTTASRDLWGTKRQCKAMTGHKLSVTVIQLCSWVWKQPLHYRNNERGCVWIKLFIRKMKFEFHKVFMCHIRLFLFWLPPEFQKVQSILSSQSYKRRWQAEAGWVPHWVVLFFFFF